ncbi:DsbA family protein [Undibacterium sp. TJN19]|uniref:DsbA family protein n=1 Tax=Undibacterium sp. TJN19 TaxID=3413055 RepID=UPI003BF1FB86
MTSKLHIVFDPLCGWCYAASPFLRQLHQRFSETLPVEFHPGLLFAQASTIPHAYREHIIAADKRIAALSGVTFGKAYLDKVARAAELRYWSVPASAAVMSQAQADTGTALSLLEKIQHAHYVEALDVSDLTVLSKLAQELGVQHDVFMSDYVRSSAALPGQAELAHQLLQRVGASGFPSFILEKDSQLLRLDHGGAYQHPEPLLAEIARHLPH